MTENKTVMDYKIFEYDGGWAVNPVKTDINADEFVFNVNAVEWFPTEEQAREYNAFLNATGYGDGDFNPELALETLEEKGIKCIELSEAFGETMRRLAGEDGYPDCWDMYFKCYDFFVILPMCKMAFVVNIEAQELSRKEDFENYKYEIETLQEEGYKTEQDYWKSRKKFDWEDEFNILYGMFEDIERKYF